MAKKGLAAASKAIDPTLGALFSSSSGPVKAPSKSRYTEPLEKITRPAAEQQEEGLEGDDDELSETSEKLDNEDEDQSTPGSEDNAEDDISDSDSNSSHQKEPLPDDAEAIKHAVDYPSKSHVTRREKKRKRKDDNDDLEDRYLAEITSSDAAKPVGKRRKADDSNEAQQEEDEESRDESIPVHESLTKGPEAFEIEKAARTVFLANVSSEAISSKSARKILEKHLLSIVDSEASFPQKIESLRFRSVAFSTASMPKRAAYITKSLMSSTTKSTNAYVVFSTPALARKVVAELNGSEVLGRHIRVDSIAHPSPTDHRRCVFVGNLGFVDDESLLNTDENGEMVQKKRNKVPADVEEGLWRTFGKQGRVENVRVVRDPRVGKGFAYVQFYDANDVESSLLLDGKKFPPMLPRALRVTRAKDPRKTALAQDRARTRALKASGLSANKSTKYVPKATPEELAKAGRAGKLLGRAAAAEQRGRRGFGGKFKHPGNPSMKSPEQVVFEGKRASAKDGRPKDLKFGKKSQGKPGTRSARRGAEWKKKSS